MAENLRHALRGVVQASFREHTDKHAIKRAGQGYGKVYAHSSKMDLLDKIGPFARWIRENYPDVKRPEQLTREHAQAFIDKKSAGWSQATCDGWRSQLVKLAECINARKPGASVDLRTTRVIGAHSPRTDRGAGSVISERDYRDLLDHCMTHPSGSAFVILMQEATGARVGDNCYGTTYALEGDRLRVDGKGGRVVYREISPRFAEVLRREEFEPYRSLEHLPKDGSVNKYLNRYQDARGLERHSMQDLRRFIGQAHYDAAREAGASRTEALQATSVWLSHGKLREEMVLRSYVGNAW